MTAGRSRTRSAPLQALYALVAVGLFFGHESTFPFSRQNSARKFLLPAIALPLEAVCKQQERECIHSPCLQ